MLARVQQFIVFVLAVASTGWVAYFLNGHSIAWAAAGLIFMFAGYAAVIGLEFWLLGRSYTPPDSSKPAFLELVSAWWKEVLTAPRVFLWRQPFRYQAIADFLPTLAAPRRGVVLVHGFFCNRGLWNPWTTELLQAGVPFVALTLEPVFGSIDAYTDQIEDAVRKVEVATGLAPVLVGHSMGGLAIRAWSARYKAVDRIFRAVTVGTPHRGTALARHSHTTNGREMRLGSAWLEALARAEGKTSYSGFTCFWGRCDNIVFPTESATLPGAENHHLRATPHVRMVYHPEVFAEVMRLVEPGTRA